ncbi:MAG TPA: iron chelate uptake ABC transporter family permease subunit [Methylomirabilota bacterium]
MRLRWIGTVALAMLAAACQQAPSPPAKPLVVASFYPPYEFARQIAGDRAEVASLVPSGVNADLFAILFGSIMTVSPLDVWLIGALAAGVALTLWACYPRLLAITLSDDLARTSGVPVGALNLLLTVLTALTVVVAMRMVGILMVSGMIVIPTLTGFAVGRSFRGALRVAILTALAAVVVGLIAA